MNTASFFRRLIVCVMVLTISFLYLFVNFKGLTTADGMEKSQLAREISRGSYSTKMIRPIAIWQSSQKQDREAFLDEVAATDSYNSPLYPLVLGAVFKLIGADDFETYKMQDTDTIYALDRVIAGLSVLFFLIGILISYVLAKRMFDGTIAGMTLFILVTCELFWRFTQTGMPNCLMFMLFSAALYYTYVATERSLEENRNGLLPGVLAGIFLILLCLCHWMGVWLLIGFLIYSFIFIRPVGGVVSFVIVAAILAFFYPLFLNMKQTGNPFGTAFYSLYAGLGNSNDLIMRAGDFGDVPIMFRNLALVFINNILSQITKVYEYMGYIIAAPLFFLSLIYKYKKSAVTNFKWAIFILWGLASLGMSVYGLGNNALYSKQLHYLFAAPMTAYGLSIIIILWNKMPGTRDLSGVWNKSHLILLAILASAPVLLSIPNDIFRGLTLKKSYPNWPPYFPSALSNTLNVWVDDDNYVMSDQPWAVAWYADKNAIWLPTKTKTFKQIESIAKEQRTPIAGIHISPTSFGEGSFYEGLQKSGEIMALALDGWVVATTDGTMKFRDLAKKSKITAPIISNYSYSYPLVRGAMVYHSAERADVKRK